MTTTYHQHRAVPNRREIRGYTGSVSREEEPRAHGGVCVVDHCRCGAVRRTNENQCWMERGEWVVES
jgi:hypothetical protein